MIMKLFVLTTMFFVVSTASAASPLLCDALKEDKNYKGHESFRTLVEGRDGWIFRTRTDFRENFAVKPENIALLNDLSAAFAARNITLILSIVPTRGMTDGDKAVNTAFDRNAAWTSYQELVTALRSGGLIVAAMDGDGSEPYHHKRDHHWNVAGAKAMARAVATQVREHNVVLPHKKFITEKDGKIEHTGSFNRIVKTVCDDALPAEKVDRFVTYAPGDQDDLLTDIPKPQVILLGTSHSVNRSSQSNFDGFLKEYLNADVENRAVSGGGADEAMLQWLAARDKNEAPPKLVV